MGCLTFSDHDDHHPGEELVVVVLEEEDASEPEAEEGAEDADPDVCGEREEDGVPERAQAWKSTF